MIVSPDWYVPFSSFERDRIGDLALQHPLQRAGPEVGVVARLRDPLLRRRRELEREPALGQPVAQDARPGSRRSRSISSSDSRWNTTISSMRLRNSGLKCARTAAITCSSARARAEVRRHDHDRVREVDRATLTVGEAAVVHQLQQHVEHVGVGLLDLVEQDHRVRTAAHRLGELTALFVADVAGRRADEARHGVLLHVLRHVDAHHRPLVVEQELGERARELGLADAGRAEEQERADRPVRIGQTRRANAGSRSRPRPPPRPGRRRARAGALRAARASPSRLP